MLWPGGKLPARARYRKPECRQRVKEMGGKRRLDQGSVGKTQPPGMKMQLPGDGAPGMRPWTRPGMCPGMRTGTAIFAVTYDRMAFMRHMNAKLMRTPGTRPQRDQRLSLIHI